jgi:putative hemolysin
MALELLLIVLLILANGIFSGSEMAIVSARKARLEQLAEEGNRKARLALKLANSPNDFLSTVQIGITLIGILSGAVGGATLALRLRPVLQSIPALAPYSEPISLVIVVSLITYFSLVLGELVPKRLALSNAEDIACAVAGPMRLLARGTAPLVHLLSSSTDGLLQLVGVRHTEESPVTEEEIRVLLEQGTRAGLFEEAEQEMVSRVFRLGDRPVKSLMTPRTAITWLDVDAPMEETQQEILNSPHSRFPVGEGSLDECVGIIRVKDFLSAYLAGEAVNLRSLLQSPLFVAENTRALDVVEIFRQSGTHFALITDEFGGIEGLITLNDVMEAIVGNLPSEDLNEPRIAQRDDGSWLVDGLIAVEELKDLLDQEELPHEQKGHYQTLAGFVLTMMGRIPSAGQHFDWGGFRFEVMDMDGARVDKVLVVPIAPDPDAAETAQDAAE